MENVTRIINSLGDSENPADRSALLDAIYRELRTMAASKMANERPDHTLQPTALVNEAYLRLVGSDQTFQNRRHFYASASEVMRRILVDSARRRTAAKRGGNQENTVFDEHLHPPELPDERVLLIHDALEKLQLEDELNALIVKLRFFVGLNHVETAELLELNEKTVRRRWDQAKIWLFRTIKASPQ